MYTGENYGIGNPSVLLALEQLKNMSVLVHERILDVAFCDWNRPWKALRHIVPASDGALIRN